MKTYFGLLPVALAMLWGAVLSGCQESPVDSVATEDMAVVPVGLVDLALGGPQPPRLDLASGHADLGIPKETLPVVLVPYGFLPPEATNGFSVSANEQWMVGKRGLIVHSTGTNWNVVTSPTNQDLVAIWGSGPSDIYAVSKQILHYDGTAWSVVRDLLVEQYYDVWGSGPDDVWAVGTTFDSIYGAGQASLAVHFDGHTWSILRKGSNEILYGVWSAGAGDAWITGSNRAGSLMAHWDGTTFTQPPGTDKYTYFSHIRGTSSTDVWTFSTGSPVHWDGTAVTVMTGLPYIRNVWVGAPDNAWMVAQEATTYSFWQWNGLTWTRTKALDNSTITGLFGVPSDVWAVGNSSAGTFAVHNIGTTYDVLQSNSNIGTSTPAMWGAGANDVWAVQGYPALSHWDGLLWRPYITFTRQGRQLTSIWGSSATDIWAAGIGLTLHFDGTAWQEVPELASDKLYAISGSGSDLWAAGDGVFHNANDGKGFVASTEQSMFSGRVVWETAPGDVWLGGTAGSALHFDGTSLTPVFVPTGTANDLTGIWGASASNVWAVNGRIAMNWNGKVWQLFSELGGSCVWGSGARDIWIGGNNVVYQNDGWRWLAVPVSGKVVNIWGSSPSDIWFATPTYFLHYKK